MTRKDYRVLAEALKEAKRRASSFDIVGVDVAQQAVVEVLARDNPRFDRQRFDLAAAEES